MASGIALMILFSMSFYMIFFPVKSEGISVDGDFSDWSDVQMYCDLSNDQHSNTIDVTLTAIENGEDYLYFYVETRGNMFQGIGSNGDIVRIFIDSDASPSTGYYINNIGADYLIEVYGINNEILSSNYYEYYIFNHIDSNLPRTQYDWNAWAPMFRVDCQVNGNRMEAKLWVDELRISSQINPRILVQSIDPLGNYDFSSVFTQEGAIEAVLYGVGVNSLTPGRSNEFLTISLSNRGEEACEIDGLTFNQDSTAVMEDIKGIKLYYRGEFLSEGIIESNSFSFSNLRLSIDTPISLNLVLLIHDGAKPGHAISLSLVDIDTKAGVTYSNERISAYISVIPSNPILDGLFGEWTNPRTDENDDVSNPNLNILAYDAMDLADFSYFYLNISGDLLTGDAVTSRGAINIPTSKIDEEREKKEEIIYQETVLPEMWGEDTILIFLETSSSFGWDSTENHVSSAEYLISIKGKQGRIISSELLRFSGNNQYEWKWDSVKEINATNNRHEIEIQCDIIPQSVSFVIEDWNQDVENMDTCKVNLIEPTIISSSRDDYPLVVYGYAYDTDGITTISDVNVSVTNNDSNHTITRTTNSNGKYQVTFNNFTENDTIKVFFRRENFLAVNIGYAPNSGIMQLNGTFPILINEVMFDPEGEDLGKEWIEIYNPGNATVNLSGWKLMNKQYVSYTIQDFSITKRSLFVIYFTTGTNNTTAVFSGINITFLNNTNESLLLNNSKNKTIDFLCWGGASSLGKIAENNGHWLDGTYISLSGYVEGNTIARDINSTDTNTLNDWNISCGINSKYPTPETKNIPEFNSMLYPSIGILIMVTFNSKNRRRKKTKQRSNRSFESGISYNSFRFILN